MNETGANIMQLTPRQIEALDRAEKLLVHSNFCPYLDLKRLFHNPSPLVREIFRDLFVDYYALNTGGLTAEFKDKFFEILFSESVLVGGEPDYASILETLYAIKRKKGDHSLQFSFVSKLVNMHLESSPIYDKHVGEFFAQSAPTGKDLNARIAGCITLLGYIQQSYLAWAQMSEVKAILARFVARDEQPKNCHVVRQLDFLVWKVGNKKLLA